MKGVRPRDEEKTRERVRFMHELFRQDCKDRARVGYVDPPLSAPRAQEKFRRKFRVGMNSQALYKIRAEVFAEAGLDSRGRPLVPTPAERRTAPLAVAVIPVADEAQGNFLKAALGELRAKGLIEDDVDVDAVHQHYATVSKFKE